MTTTPSPDTIDVDDDNDGLIEIATAADLNNMRYDLAGHSYDNEDDDSAGNEGSTVGASTNATTHCPDETSVGSGIYLCGYELVAEIEFSGDISKFGSNIDLNAGTAGNFDPIGNSRNGHFTARLEGNGYTIRGLNIDITGTSAANDNANDAAFIASCRGMINDLTLENAEISGRRRIGTLCATMNGGNVRGVQIRNAHVIQGDSTVTFEVFIGNLAGYMVGSRINNSYATGAVSSTSNSVTYIGGLVGLMKGSSSISNSTATGDVSSAISGSNYLVAGGLVGDMRNSSSISNSYATGNISVAISGNHSLVAGGLVGLMRDSSSISISNSYAMGDVSGASTGSTYVAGLVGHIHSSNLIIISNSYATGDVSAISFDPVALFNAGGLLGRMYNGNLNNSYATGNVSSFGTIGSIVGGLMTLLAAGNISNSYWNSEATQSVNGTARQPGNLLGVGSAADATGVTAKTLNQIQTLSAATLMWDDTNHWSWRGHRWSVPAAPVC